MRPEKCDVLVIGSGIAGLSFALQCARFFSDKKIVLLSKAPLEESNTHYAQGGIAAVMDRLKDSYEQHIQDTLTAGDGLCDQKIVQLVVGEAPRAMQRLMDWGVNFDRNGHSLDLGREGGHSANRILHCKDHTGASIGTSLLERVRQAPNIELRENQYVMELLCTGSEEDKRCTGALISDGVSLYTLQAHYTMLASGGVGQLYELTSNPRVATGDGIALAQQTGAKLRDMAFVQFHPTVLYEPGAEKPFLISEALRGFGGVLRDFSGREFMYRYDSRGSLATRDIVARAIFREMEASEVAHLWLDLRHLDCEEIKRKFPTIAARVQQLGIDICTEMIPIVPAAHYFCGGIQTDQWAQTSLPGLLACGENARTGLHGANRLASNSLLEALVFSRQAFLNLKENFEETPFREEQADLPEYARHPLDLSHLRQRLQQLMTRKVGIIRTNEKLLQAREEVLEIFRQLPKNDYSIPGRELRNLVAVGLAVIDDSLAQKENRGGFFRSDLAEVAY